VLKVVSKLASSILYNEVTTSLNNQNVGLCMLIEFHVLPTSKSVSCRDLIYEETHDFHRFIRHQYM